MQRNELTCDPLCQHGRKFVFAAYVTINILASW